MNRHLMTFFRNGMLLLLFVSPVAMPAVNFTSSNAASVNENSTADILAVVADSTSPDRKIVSLTIHAGDDGGLFTLSDDVMPSPSDGQSASARLSFAAGRDFENPVDVGGTAGDNVYQLTVQAEDDNAQTQIQVISITVNDVNDAPTATNLTDSIVYTEDDATVNLANIVVSDIDDSLTPQTITVNLTLNDINAGALSTPAGSTYTSASGLWTISDTVANVNTALASVEFLPDANYDTDTSITTHVEDQVGASPGDGVITLDVTPVNDAPTYVSGSYSNQTVDEDSGDINLALDSAFTDNDIDGDSDPTDDSHSYTITIIDTPDPAVMSFVFDDAAFTLTSEDLDTPVAGSRTVVIDTTDASTTLPLVADAHGSLNITVRATDEGRPPEAPAAAVPLFDEKTFTVTVQGIGDDAPDAEDDHYSSFPELVIDEDSDPIIFDVTTNDYLGDAPTVVLNAGVTITDSFGADHTWRSTSRFTDRTNTGDFVIEINGEVSCAQPGCQDDQTPDTSISGAGLGANQIEYKPGLDYHGEDSFTYCLQDGFPSGEAPFTPPSDDRCATVTILINPVNDLPRVPNDVIYTMDQADDLIVPVDEGLATQVTGVDYTHVDGLGCNPNDTSCAPHADIDDLYFFFDSAVTAHGQLIPPFETDGSFTYRPSATFAGSDSFLFDVCETAVPTVETCIFDVVATIVVEAIEGAPPGLSDDIVEAGHDLADIPLELPVGPEANVLIVNDDSGSMKWDILTDQNSGLYFFNTGNYIYYTMKATAGSSSYVAPGEQDAPNQGLWRLRNSTYNRVYYNPAVRYDPWDGLNPDNIDFPHSSPTSALHNPLSPSGNTTNLRTPQNYTGRAVITAPATCEWQCVWYWRGSCRSQRYVCSGGSGFQTVSVEDLYLPRYYVWDDLDSDGLLDDVPSPILDPDNSEGTLVEIRPAAENGGYPVAGSGTYPKAVERTDCVENSDSCTYDEEIRNFANWFTYARNREYTAKSALGKVVAASENIRVGYAKLNSPSNLKPIVSMNTSKRTGAKAALLDAIYLTTSSGGTPLRRSLRDAGRHFECRANDIFNSESNSVPGNEACPVFEAPAGNCQQNFTLLITDGAWNGGSPFPGTPDQDDDDNTEFDGGVYAGSYNESLADVAIDYYERDLQLGLLNEVPTSSRDKAGAADNAFENGGNERMHQHMKTYTVGFGVNGLVNDDDVPTDYTQTFNWGNPTTTERKIDDLRHAAVNGRGQYLSAGDAATLAESLITAFEEFQQGSGSASAVSFNSQEILEDTLIFRSFYNTKNNTGDLVAQGIDEDGVIDAEVTWSAAERLDLVTYDERVIITFDRDPTSETYAEGIPFRPTSITSAPRANTGAGINEIQRLAFIGNTGAPQSQQDLEVLQRVNYLRGDDSNERPMGNLRERPVIEGRLGDIVHSAPTFIGPPSRLGRDSPPFPQTDLYSDFRKANELRTPVVYVSANDGMIHGFNAETGDEMIGYVPDNLMTNLFSNDITDLLEYQYSHQYYVDSTPAVNDVYMDADGDGDKEWRTILISAQGKGGKALVALDITDPTRFDEDNASQVALWEFTDDDDTYPTDAAGDPLLDDEDNLREDLQTPARPAKDLGYTYSVPTIVMSNIVEPDGENKWVTLFGNGYNSSAGIAKLFILFLDGGIDSVWCHPDMIHTPVLNGELRSDCVGKQEFVKLDTGFGVQGGLPNGLGEPRAIDTDGNGTADYVYAGDQQGNFFRFDITDSDFRNWSVTKIFKAQYKPGTLDERDQPITTQPIAIIHPTEEEGFIIIFGTGSYMRSGDSTDSEIQSIYGIWDRLSPELIMKSDLQEQVYTNLSDSLGLVRTLSDNDVDYSIIGGRKGWYIDLDSPPSGFPDGAPAELPGEKAVRNIQLRGGLAFVNSIFPRSEGSCVGQAGGATLSFCPDTGGSRCFGNRTVFDLNNDGVFDDNDDVNSNETAAGIILEDPAPPTDSTFIGDKRVTQYGRELHIIGTNTSSGSNTGRLSWKRLETVD